MRRISAVRFFKPRAKAVPGMASGMLQDAWHHNAASDAVSAK